MSFGSTVLVVIWLAVGFSSLLVGLVWLRWVDSRVHGPARGRVATAHQEQGALDGAPRAVRPRRVTADARAHQVVGKGAEPDSLAG